MPAISKAIIGSLGGQRMRTELEPAPRAALTLAPPVVEVRPADVPVLPAVTAEFTTPTPVVLFCITLLPTTLLVTALLPTTVFATAPLL